MIKAVTVYETKGQQFASLDKAVQHRENLIDEFLRKLPGYQDMPARSRVAFMQGILDNRATLRDLLNYSTERPKSENDWA